MFPPYEKEMYKKNSSHLGGSPNPLCGVVQPHAATNSGNANRPRCDFYYRILEDGRLPAEHAVFLTKLPLARQWQATAREKSSERGASDFTFWQLDLVVLVSRPAASN